MSFNETPNKGYLDILRHERRNLLDLLRKTRFTTLKTGYSQSQVIPHASYSPWLDDEAFNTTYAAVKSHTLVDIYRCYELHTLARQAAAHPGDLVEIGVWRGGTAALIGCAAPTKTLHLFDTFEGVAKADQRYDTLYKGGEHADTDQEMVQALLQTLSLHAEIHPGIFPEDSLAYLPPQIAMAHIDVDTYQSAYESFHAIWPRVQTGGVIVFDDYGFFGCEGVTQAVDELRNSVKGAAFVHNLNGHGIIFRVHRS